MELAQYWCGFGHVSPSVGLHPMRRTQREKNFFLADLPSLITCGGKASVVAASGEKGSRGDVRQVAIFMVHGGINDAETSEVVVPSTPVLLLSMWLLQLDGFFGLQVVSPTSASSPLQDHPTSRKTG